MYGFTWFAIKARFPVRIPISSMKIPFQAERHAADMSFQIDALSERLDEAGGSSSQTVSSTHMSLYTTRAT